MSDAETFLSDVLIIAFTLEVFASIWAWWGIRRIYKEERGDRSVIFRSLYRLLTAIVFAAAALLPIAVIALLNMPRLPGTGMIVAIVLMILLAPALWMRVTFEKIRRRRGRVVAKEEVENDEDAAD